jgi:hypothetical protein
MARDNNLISRDNESDLPVYSFWLTSKNILTLILIGKLNKW